MGLKKVMLTIYGVQHSGDHIRVGTLRGVYINSISFILFDQSLIMSYIHYLWPG